MSEYSVQHCKPCITCCTRIEKRLDGSAADVVVGDDDASGVDNESLLVLLDQSAPLTSKGESDALNCTKCNNLHQMLQERTTQLKIMMETMEALQLGDSKHTTPTGVDSSSALPSASLEDIMANLDAGSMSRDDAKLEQLFNAGVYPQQPQGHTNDRERQPLGHGSPGHAQQWEARALVKRIVELTADSSAHCSEQAMTERQLRQLESDKTHLRKDMNKLLKKLKQMETNSLSLHKKYSTALLNLNRLEKLRTEENNSSEARLEEMMKVVRERENECDEMRVSTEEMKQQMELADRSAFQTWFTELTTVPHPHDREAGTMGGNAGVQSTPNTDLVKTESSGNSVRSLVVTLLVQWRDQV